MHHLRPVYGSDPGYARGTLALREGLVAQVPAIDPRPIVTMDDMGMGGMAVWTMAAWLVWAAQKKTQVTCPAWRAWRAWTTAKMTGMDQSDMTGMTGMDSGDMTNMAGVDHSKMAGMGNGDMSGMAGMGGMGECRHTLPLKPTILVDMQAMNPA